MSGPAAPDRTPPVGRLPAALGGLQRLTATLLCLAAGDRHVTGGWRCRRETRHLAAAGDGTE